MATNSWQVGTLYKNPFHGVPWSQPGGVGTQVFPAQRNGIFDAYPVPGVFFIEASGLWFCGCIHSVDYPLIFKDFDNLTSQSVALVCCPLCSFIQYTIEPYEGAFDTVTNPVIII